MTSIRTDPWHSRKNPRKTEVSGGFSFYAGSMKFNDTEVKIEMKILIADDHPDVCSALKLLLEQELGLCVTAGVGNMEELWTAMKEYCPDLLFLDWELPGNNDEELVQAIRKKCPKLITITMSSRPEVHKLALNAGADGFISKGSSAQEVVTAVKGYLKLKGGTQWRLRLGEPKTKRRKVQK